MDAMLEKSGFAGARLPDDVKVAAAILLWDGGNGESVGPNDGPIRGVGGEEKADPVLDTVSGGFGDLGGV